MIQLPPARLTFICFLISFGGSFLYGIQLCIPSALEPVLSDFINGSYWSHYKEPISHSLFNTLYTVYVSALYTGALISALIMPQFTNRLGRNPSLYGTVVLFLISALTSGLSYTANSFVLLIAGRFLYGISCGVGIGVGSLYIGEISPMKYRGTLGSFTSILLEFGLGVSAIIGLPDILGTEYHWQYIFYIQIIPPILLLVILPLLPESPKFLCMSGKQSLAEKSIAFFHGENADVKFEIEHIFDDLRIQETSMNVFQIWQDPAIRKAAFMGCVVNFATSGSGIVAVNCFATIILQESGLSVKAALYCNVAIACSTFFTVIFASHMVEGIGRRPLVLYGTIILNLLNGAIMGQLIYFQYDPTATWIGYTVAGTSVLFMMAIGLGPLVVQFFFALELVPLNAKAATQTVAIMSNFAGSLYSGLLFLPLNGAIGPYCYLIFIIPLSGVCVYYYFCLPETKNRTVAQVMEAMGSKLAGSESRKDLVNSKSAVCFQSVDTKQIGVDENKGHDNAGCVVFM